MSESEIKIKIAGHGGQGVVLAGNVMARACMLEGRFVTGMVSYGVEMRGGTANATLVISDEEISSPVVVYPNLALILNQPSLDRFEPLVTPGGFMIINVSMTQRDIERGDLNCAEVDATELAKKLGDPRVANIVALGACIGATEILRPDSIRQSIEDLFQKKNRQMTDINLQAFNQGLQNVRVHSLQENEKKIPIKR